MALNNDFESLLDALTDEDTDENEQFQIEAERKFMTAAAELEPALNRVVIQSRVFKKWYRGYLLAGGRGIPRYDALLARVRELRVPLADLGEVRAIQSAEPAYVPPPPLDKTTYVMTAYGPEVVTLPYVPAVHTPKPGIVSRPLPLNNAAAKQRAASISLDEVAAFYNLVVEKFKRPPTIQAVGTYFGLSDTWAAGRVGEAFLRKKITVVRKAGDGYGPRDLTSRILEAFGTYSSKKGVTQSNA